MVVLRLIGTVLWFAVPAALLTFASHDLAVRDAPTYSVEGTVVAHRQETHAGGGDDPTVTTTYFVTIRGGADGDEFEVGSNRQALDTEPGTQVVVQVSEETHEVVVLRKGGTVVDLRMATGDLVWLIVLSGLGLLVAVFREFVLEDVDVPRWAGFVLGALAACGGVWFALSIGG